MFFEEDESHPVKRNWKRIILDPVNMIAIIGVIIIIFMNGKWGVYDKATTIGILLILLAPLIKLTHISWMHMSPKLITQSGWTTITGFREAVGNWYIYRRGGINYGVTIEGKDGLSIIPIASENRIGKSVAATVTEHEVPFEELPSNVQEYIILRNLKGPYYWGIASEEQALWRLEDREELTGIRQPTVEYLINQIRNLNRANTFLTSLVKDKFSTVQKFMGDISRIKMKSERGSFAEAVKRAIKEERVEE